MRKLSILLIIFIGCTKNIKINPIEIENWNKLNKNKLTKCCPNFEKSLKKNILFKNFSKNVRNKVLNSMTFNRNENILFFFETYENVEPNYINVFVNNKYKYCYKYYTSKDSLVKNQKNLGVISFEDKEDLIEVFKDSSIMCCNNEISHSSISIYSKIKLSESKLEIIETYTK